MSNRKYDICPYCEGKTTQHNGLLFCDHCERILVRDGDFPKIQAFYRERTETIQKLLEKHRDYLHRVGQLEMDKQLDQFPDMKALWETVNHYNSLKAETLPFLNSHWTEENRRNFYHFFPAADEAEKALNRIEETK